MQAGNGPQPECCWTRVDQTTLVQQHPFSGMLHPWPDLLLLALYSDPDSQFVSSSVYLGPGQPLPGTISWTSAFESKLICSCSKRMVKNEFHFSRSFHQSRTLSLKKWTLFREYSFSYEQYVLYYSNWTRKWAHPVETMIATHSLTTPVKCRKLRTLVGRVSGWE